MSKIADYNDADRWVVETALKERYGERVALEIADAEIRLDPGLPELTECPTLYWKHAEVEFVIFKIPGDLYRAQFFYSRKDQYGIGKDFDNLADCVTALLRLQADHEKERAGVSSGKTAKDLNS